MIESFVDVSPKKVTPTMRHILTILANFAGDEDSAYPRQNTIARITGLTRACVNKNLKLMEEIGVLSAEGRVRADGSTRSSEYTIHMDVLNLYDGPVPAEEDGVNQDDTINHHLEPSSEPKTRTTPKPRKTASWPADYREQFWKLYPPRRNSSKKAALEKLDKFEAEDRVEFEVIMTGLRYFAERTKSEIAKDRSRAEFVPHATTWLNQERWETEGPPDKPRSVKRVAI
ncbi:hypothetical protein [Bradyrhizobium sp. th.b2]|uniref:hypothetical protein n=1 Tax=Bradyrhizobium sp. th-b2 TaxID=172088 RepID=UPI0012EBC5C1|nr:hypothetical protein [Bradyrhizobium sp. th.b2]